MAVYKVTVDEATTVLGVTEAVTILSEQVTGVQGPTGTNGTNGTNGATPVFTSTVPASPAVTIAIGSRTFVVDAGLSFVVGQYVRVADSANPSRYMAGPISAYSGTSLTITSSETAGTGTLGAAIVSLSGTRGFGYGGVSSVTSQNITTGSKTFALTLSLGPHAYIIGERVRIINSTTNFIEGTITAISQTSMTVDVTLANGSGTYTAWTFAIAGAPGSTGATGATGSSGVVDVDSGELTNTGTSTAAQLGLATAGTAGTYTKVTTDTFGRVTTGTTLVAGDIPTIAATQVTGTAYTKANKVVDDYRLASTYDIIPRLSVGSTRNLNNGVIYGTVFTPQENFTVNNIQSFTQTGGTDVGGTTVRRMGLFTLSGNTATLVARTDSDATLFSASNTLYTRALSTTGGYPSSYTLTAGTEYLFGVIAYNTGGAFNIPTIAAGNITTQTFTPAVNLGLTGQTDLPTGATAFGPITNAIVFARLT